MDGTSRICQAGVVCCCRFEDPLKTRGDRFVWDFWHVEGQYSLMRTPAHEFFPRKLSDALEDALIFFGESRLGCRGISPIWLSYYIDGCRQVPLFHGPQGVARWSGPLGDAMCSFCNAYPRGSLGPPQSWSPGCREAVHHDGPLGVPRCSTFMASWVSPGAPHSWSAVCLRWIQVLYNCHLRSSIDPQKEFAPEKFTNAC